jgi:hypothetical protein
MSGETQRQWLARQLLDDRLSDEEAFGITAYHPSVSTEYHGGKYVGGTATIKVLIGECDQCHDVNRRLRAELSRLTADNERLMAALRDRRCPSSRSARLQRG